MTDEQFNSCVEHYADRVFRFIWKNIRNEHDANDIVQNAFEILWRKHAEIDHNKARQYLFTTAYNNMIDQIRKRSRIDHHAEISEDSKIGMNGYDGLKEALDKALRTLPEIQKTLVLLKDYEGYSYEEIGEITDLNPSQVKVYLFRARKSLQKQLISIHNLV
ncbi:MAG: RNA polymerase sigma factor [Bacteroidetes bacterium]|nr:RNA polymerase sigma factor [Bacteroidota bacterium]